MISYYWPRKQSGLMDPLILRDEDFTVIFITSVLGEALRLSQRYDEPEVVDPRDDLSDWVQVPNTFFLLKGIDDGA